MISSKQETKQEITHFPYKDDLFQGHCTPKLLKAAVFFFLEGAIANNKLICHFLHYNV